MQCQVLLELNGIFAREHLGFVAHVQASLLPKAARLIVQAGLQVTAAI